MLRRVTLVKTDVPEERIASTIRVARIGDIGTTLALAKNRSTLRRNTILSVVREPRGATSQKRAFIIVTAVKTSNLT
jgi:hypothetical protein